MTDNYYPALIVFIIAACTDFIDGAMARTRNQITDTGKVIDPIADKLLILSVLVFFAGDYLVVKIFIVFIILELLAVMLGVLFSYTIGRPMGANVFGKIKMVLQSFGVGFFILGLLIDKIWMVEFAEDVLYAALVFAVLAGLSQFRNKLIRLEKHPHI
jgi:CDP-diacylglycerol--glycerol-3-phosphate 3-phosphatidyltransferase